MGNPDNRTPQIVPETPGAKIQPRPEHPVKDSDTEDVDPDSAESENNRDDTVDDDDESSS